MDTHKELTIGLFGFGVVGEGLYKVLQQTPSLKAQLKKVCIKHPGKKRNAPTSLFTTEKGELLNDPEINVIVEVIDDADAAYEIVSTALRNGKDVVSASKKMIAEHLPSLLALQQETGQSLSLLARIVNRQDTLDIEGDQTAAFASRTTTQLARWPRTNCIGRDETRMKRQLLYI